MYCCCYVFWCILFSSKHEKPSIQPDPIPEPNPYSHPNPSPGQGLTRALLHRAFMTIRTVVRTTTKNGRYSVLYLV